MVLDPDGKIIFLNKALLELYSIKEPLSVIEKYNLLDDPVFNGRTKLCESIRKVFNGETVRISDYRTPIQELLDSGVLREKPYESDLMEIYLSPYRDSGNNVFVVCVSVIKEIYRGKPDVARAKAYISRNWRGKFDPRATADALNMSIAWLYRLFKENTGMTPGQYHQQCKIENIKKKLRNRDMTIKEVFEACGENSGGWILSAFKKVTGLTPTEYRNQF